MSRLRKGIIFGMVTAATGLLIGFSPPGHHLKESVGLNLFFKLRGARKAPADVVIVSMDEVSAHKLNLSVEPGQWPRLMHARLTNALSRSGASVVAFDVTFDEPKSDSDDQMFAQAIRYANNVVLVECLMMRIVPLKESAGVYAADLHMEQRVEPIALLRDAAVAHAPFPLPKMPAKVSQYWAFKKGAEDFATLPVVAFQLFALDLYPEFIQVLKSVAPETADKLPKSKEAIIRSKNIEMFIRFFRNIHTEKPNVIEKMVENLQSADTQAFDQKKKNILRSLFKMYQGQSLRYLNFYGPPGTITTISYYQALEDLEDHHHDEHHFDFAGRAVFIGYSEMLRTDQKDGFYTVFSEPTGVDISGVEIAATAFANLLEDFPVQPLKGAYQFTIILLWGLGLGILCRMLPIAAAGIGSICIGALYLAFAHVKFSNSGVWFPVTIPLLVQMPFAFFGTLVWKYIDTQKERKHIRRAFGYYLPDTVVDQLARNMGDIESGNQPVHGTCLFTDAGEYTTLSETMDPAELSSFMNKYYETLFGPVKQHEGIVINVVGDSMLALWATGKPDRSFRQKACFAALDIDRKVHEFNQSPNGVRLPIRIGLHSGRMLLGSIGAMDHYEYRPVGDIVNTASRMEGLNKYLNTQILVSKEVLLDLDGFFTRELGTFRLAGKAKPTQVFELLYRMEDATESHRKICKIFSKGLAFFREQSFQAAMDTFNECITINPDDGPSNYYVNICKQYLDTPPQSGWDGIVDLIEK